MADQVRHKNHFPSHRQNSIEEPIAENSAAKIEIEP